MNFINNHIMSPIVDYDDNQPVEISDISKISFGILSPEEILKMSCCNVTSVKISDDGDNIYSKRMGTIENNETCKTCDNDVWVCPGHFGHLKLEVPVVNPIFINDVTNILRCICFNCYGFVLSEDHLKLEKLTKKFANILVYVKNIKRCYRCESEKTTISVVNETIVDEYKNPIDTKKILRILENIDDNTVKLLGFNPTMSHPKNFVFTIFPILPPCCRPYVISDENCCDDDLTYQLVEIIKIPNYFIDFGFITFFYCNVLFISFICMFVSFICSDIYCRIYSFFSILLEDAYVEGNDLFDC